MVGSETGLFVVRFEVPLLVVDSEIGSLVGGIGAPLLVDSETGLLVTLIAGSGTGVPKVGSEIASLEVVFGVITLVVGAITEVVEKVDGAELLVIKVGIKLSVMEVAFSSSVMEVGVRFSVIEAGLRVADG